VDPRFFCGDNFLQLVALDEIMAHMLRNHGSWATDDGNHVIVSNPSEMISIVIPITRVNNHVPKPQNGDERLDPQCDEIQCQMQLPQSFVLINIIPNSMGVSTFYGVSRMVPSSIYKSKAPTCLLGVTKVVCHAPLFSINTLVISSIESTIMFRLAAT
jgi:hypothetical protein